MKLNKTIYTLSALTVLTLSSSCAHFLDTPTDTRVDLVNDDQLRMLMNAAYPSTCYAWPLELMSDNMEDNNAPEGPGNEGVHYNLSGYDRGDDEMFRWEPCLSSTDSDTPSGIWEGFYNSSAYANAVIAKIDEIKAENGELNATQKALRAEALVLRAYNHFVLAQVFCEPYRGSLSANHPGIPYITEPEVKVKPHYDRGTLAQTYELIEKDLLEGMADIDNGIYAVAKYHFNSTAAHAFAARFYLFTRQYAKCIEHADIVFGGADVDPTPYMSTLWQQLGELYYISDMGLYQNGISQPSNFLLYPTYTRLLRRFGSGSRYGVIRNALDATIHGSTPAWARFRWSKTNGKGGTFTMHPCFNGSCIRNGQDEYGTVCCANVDEQFEYTDKIAGIGYCRHTRREFYGEETLLCRAEAKLFMGDTQGFIHDIDVWEKARRNCPSAAGYEDNFADFTVENLTAFYGGDPGYGICKTINIDQICPESDQTVSTESIMPLLQAIQHIRRIETIHKGFRWFDIKRYGLEFDRKIGNNNGPDYHTMDHLGVFDPRKAVQIPAEVIAAGMQPNPRQGDVQETVNPTTELQHAQD